jgi:hypothetical protein
MIGYILLRVGPVNNGLSRCGFALMRATPLDKDVVKQLFYRLVSVGF